MIRRGIGELKLREGEIGRIGRIGVGGMGRAALGGAATLAKRLDFTLARRSNPGSGGSPPYAGVIFPSTTRFSAPVAWGTLAGVPMMHSLPRMAKAMASRASVGMPY